MDPGLFGGGTFPCREITANLQGKPTFDRPHLIKFGGAYNRPVGPIDLTAGLVGSAVSKTTYSKQRTIQVLSPVTNAQFATMTYFYEPRGDDRIEGLLNVYDFAFEATWRGLRATNAVGVKFDIFNLFNNEEKLNVSNQTWCNSTATAACATTVANYGTATARNAFQVARQVPNDLAVPVLVGPGPSPSASGFPLSGSSPRTRRAPRADRSCDDRRGNSHFSRLRSVSSSVQVWLQH